METSLRSCAFVTAAKASTREIKIDPFLQGYTELFPRWGNTITSPTPLAVTKHRFFSLLYCRADSKSQQPEWQRIAGAGKCGHQCSLSTQLIFLNDRKGLFHKAMWMKPCQPGKKTFPASTCHQAKTPHHNQEENIIGGNAHRILSRLCIITHGITVMLYS